jgi:hypothetical protein
MMLDDHEVTDDWNRTKAWQARAEASPLGRRIIANGLLAFWAMQACGNDPASGAPDFATAGSAFMAGAGGGDPSVYEKAALAFRDFSFVAPTHPPVVVVDMRTTRGPDAGDQVDGKAPDPDAPCEVLGKKGLAAFVSKAKSVCAPGKLLVVVAPPPVIGFAQWERPQEAMVETGIERVNADMLDLESWHGNPPAYHRFLIAIAEQVRPGATLFISGDVHFGHVSKAVLTPKADPSKPVALIGFTQFTSSAFKHQHSAGLQVALDIADTFVPDLTPEWVWKAADPSDLPKVRLALKRDLVAAVAENGGQPPDYTHRSYGVGATLCSDVPLLLPKSNIGQLEMADAAPTTLAGFTYYAADGSLMQRRELYLDWRWALRPRDQ